MLLYVLRFLFLLVEETVNLVGTRSDAEKSTYCGNPSGMNLTGSAVKYDLANVKSLLIVQNFHQFVNIGALLHS